MLDNIQPYKYQFVQKASPSPNDAFDRAYIYKFFTERTDTCQSLKYIIRVEQHDNVFALKFYAARDRKNENKYHRIMNVHNYRGTLRLLVTCLAIVPEILNIYPHASFVVNGANSRDLRTRTEEDVCNNQRFRIYKELTLRKISDKLFEHFYFDEASSYLLVNRTSASDMVAEAERLKNLLLDIYDI